MILWDSILFFLRFFFFNFLCICVLPACLSYMRVPDPMELELQTSLSYDMGLEVEFRSSGTAARMLLTSELSLQPWDSILLKILLFK